MRQENNNEELNCHEIITSEDYVDLYHQLRGNIEEAAKEAGAECVQRIFEDWGMFHIKVDPDQCEEFYLDSEYRLLPNLYGLTSMSSIEAAGIGSVLKSTSLDVSGNGVIIAIIDTGIDYLHEAFRYEDNTSKILSIWDQTQEGTPPEGFLYGTEFTNQQINEAISSDDPLSIVPTVDEIGHGTFLAGVAAGRPKPRENFQGAAPDSDLIVVKLKQAKKCIKDFFQIKEGAIAFQTNDIFQGFNYVLEKSDGKPIVVLFAISSSDGPHNGTSEIEEYMAKQGDSIGVVVITAAGNEANASRHYHGSFEEDENRMEIELNIAENEKGLFFNVYVPLPDKVSLELISPSGNSTGRFPIRSNEWQEKEFPLEASLVRIHYDLLDARSAEESIAVFVINPLPGIWNLVVYGDLIINGEFDIYLPTNDFIERNTIFLKPDPYTTIVLPSTNPGTITVGAYNEVINSIYLQSGRGYTRDERIKPDIVAPGTNVVGPYPKNQYGVLSGTSVSSAITAGASALLLEWGIVKGNDPSINTIATKAYLSRGARRRPNVSYPNREWGYGELDLFKTFQELQ
ncbi:S8 family peptidase [Vallitalea okinawensis]|uniref:S8 family peptidase n=1 Tax=Vallitalea okinawensis TaxID=2078660 RepID=UPI0014789D12|nr:S8 family peptidase [Vallitalea okinawensis]